MESSASWLGPPAPAAPPGPLLESPKEADTDWAADPAPSRPGKRQSWLVRRLGPTLAALVALLAKLKTLLLLLPKLKLLTTLGTMLVLYKTSPVLGIAALSTGLGYIIGQRLPLAGVRR